MKIALLISGYLRTIKYNIQNIKQNIIQNHDCDIYIHITVDSEKDKYYNHKNNINIEKILHPTILIKSIISIFVLIKKKIIFLIKIINFLY